MKRYPTGLFSTCVIPWNENGQFEEAIFRQCVQDELDGTKHLYLFGTAGEGYALTDDQFNQIVTAFVDEMRNGDADPMIGLIDLSLSHMMQRIDRCKELGVTKFQISLPSWGALNDTELSDFFRIVCGSHPDCQFMHYNLPRAKRLVSGKDYGRLAEENSNLVATKNTSHSMSHIASLQKDAPQLQHFLSESGFVWGSLLGECGILVSFVMNWPRQKELLEAGLSGDTKTMMTIIGEIGTVVQALFETVPGDRIDGAYDKLFAKMYNPNFPLRLLPPYQASTDEEFEAFMTLMRERIPSWVPG